MRHHGVYAYKFQLKDKLADLQQRLKEGTYVMQEIRPLPFPKGPKVKEDGKIEKTRVRQYFHVAIEDQLVWIAYCNVIAQYAERRMPGWSYGNRTDVRVWYYEDQGNGYCRWVTTEILETAYTKRGTTPGRCTGNCLR